MRIYNLHNSLKYYITTLSASIRSTELINTANMRRGNGDRLLHNTRRFGGTHAIRLSDSDQREKKKRLEPRIEIQPKRQLPFQLEMHRRVTIFEGGCTWRLHFARYSDTTDSKT